MTCYSYSHASRMGSPTAATGSVDAGSVEHVPPTRRYPNFVAFISTGVILGFVVGSVFAYRGDDATDLRPRLQRRPVRCSSSGVVGAFVFGLLAAVVAVLLDRRD